MSVWEMSVLTVALNNWPRGERESKTVEELWTEALGTQQNNDKNNNNDKESNNDDNILTAHSRKKWQIWKKCILQNVLRLWYTTGMLRSP